MISKQIHAFISVLIDGFFSSLVSNALSLLQEEPDIGGSCSYIHHNPTIGWQKDF